MRCIEHLLQRQVDAIIVSTSLPPEHPFYQRWVNDPLPIIALDRALDREHFTSVVGADQDDAQALAAELRQLPVKNVLFSARCRSCRSASCVKWGSARRGRAMSARSISSIATALTALRRRCLKNTSKTTRCPKRCLPPRLACCRGDGRDAEA